MCRLEGAGKSQDGVHGTDSGLPLPFHRDELARGETSPYTEIKRYTRV